MVQNIDEKPELILDDEFKISRSFDDHVCSVNLQAVTNNPSESYLVAASASFGNEYVELEIDEEVIEFRMFVYKAEITIDPAHCALDAQYAPETNTISEVTNERKSESEDTSEKSIEFSTGETLSPIFNVKTSFSRSKTRKNENLETQRVSVIRVNSRTIRIESDKPLQGVLLDQYLGWRIVPEKQRDSGVFCAANVRSDWIEFVEPKPVRNTGRIWELIKSLLNSKKKDVVLERKRFDALLNKLVEIGLQNGSQTKEATISADTIIVRPNEGTYTKASLSSTRNKLQINSGLLAEFLSATAETQQTILDKLEVPDIEEIPQELPKAIDRDEDQSEETENRFRRVRDSDPLLSSLKRYLSRISYSEKDNPALARFVLQSIRSEQFTGDKMFQSKLILTNISISKSGAKRIYRGRKTLGSDFGSFSKAPKLKQSKNSKSIVYLGTFKDGALCDSISRDAYDARLEEFELVVRGHPQLRQALSELG